MLPKVDQGWRAVKEESRLIIGSGCSLDNVPVYQCFEKPNFHVFGRIK
jgi:hypothetical protein